MVRSGRVARSPGGGFDGRGASPGRERVAVGEPGDVAGVGQREGGHDGAETGSPIKVDPVAAAISVSSRVSPVAFFSIVLARDPQEGGSNCRR